MFVLEFGVLDLFIIGLLVVVIGLYVVFLVLFELRVFDKCFDLFVVKFEFELDVGIGEGFDIIGLCIVECVIVVGMFVDDGVNDVYGVDFVLFSNFFD